MLVLGTVLALQDTNWLWCAMKIIFWLDAIIAFQTHSVQSFLRASRWKVFFWNQKFSVQVFHFNQRLFRKNCAAVVFYVSFACICCNENEWTIFTHIFLGSHTCNGVLVSYRIQIVMLHWLWIPAITFSGANYWYLF